MGVGEGAAMSAADELLVQAESLARQSLDRIQQSRAVLRAQPPPVVPEFLEHATLLQLIDVAALEHDLPPGLVAAMVEVESGGSPWAMRYEPTFYDRYIAPKKWPVYGAVSRETEMRALAMSFGLMQVMGSTARTLGFRGVFLTELCNPRLGLWYGCKYLAYQRARYQGRLEDAIVAYNAGSARKGADGKWVNQGYLEKVRRAGWTT